jgi:hypothetical protein
MFTNIDGDGFNTAAFRRMYDSIVRDNDTRKVEDINYKLKQEMWEIIEQRVAELPDLSPNDGTQDLHTRAKPVVVEKTTDNIIRRLNFWKQYHDEVSCRGLVFTEVRYGQRRQFSTNPFVFITEYTRDYPSLIEDLKKSSEYSRMDISTIERVYMYTLELLFYERNQDLCVNMYRILVIMDESIRILVRKQKEEQRERNERFNSNLCQFYGMIDEYLRSIGNTEASKLFCKKMAERYKEVNNMTLNPSHYKKIKRIMEVVIRKRDRTDSKCSYWAQYMECRRLIRENYYIFY